LWLLCGRRALPLLFMLFNCQYGGEVTGDTTRDVVESESVPAAASEAEGSLVGSGKRGTRLVVRRFGGAAPLASPFVMV
jgi:hypothetical protein